MNKHKTQEKSQPASINEKLGEGIREKITKLREAIIKSMTTSKQLFHTPH